VKGKVATRSAKKKKNTPTGSSRPGTNQTTHEGKKKGQKEVVEAPTAWAKKRVAV